MFNRSSKREPSVSRKAVKDLKHLRSVEDILKDDRFEASLSSIRANSELSDTRYHSLALGLIHTLVQFYQTLPESTASYFQYAGGLLDHALQRTEAALAIFKTYLHPDEQGQYTEIQLLWQYALFSAALLQGIGKLYIDYSIAIYDGQGVFLKQWNPLQESLLSHGSYFNYEFTAETDEDLRSRLNLLLARQVMPASGFNWIASEPKVLAVWLALLNEDLYSSGTLGCILDNADAVAIQNELNRLLKMVGGRRINRMGRIGAFSDHTPEALLQLEQQTGIVFIQWVQQSLASGMLMVNKAPLLSVPGGLLMSVEIFKLFVRENPEFKNWQAVQKGFLTLGLHENAADGSLISKYEQHKSQNLINGIHLGERSSVLLPAEAKYMHSHSGEVQRLSATEIIHRMQSERSYQPSTKQLSNIESLQALMGNGEWQVAPPTQARRLQETLTRK